MSGMTTLWDRTQKQSLREHCIDVKFLLIAYKLIKHYCLELGKWEKKTIYALKKDGILKTVEVKWLLLAKTAKLSIIHQHNECCKRCTQTQKHPKATSEARLTEKTTRRL